MSAPAIYLRKGSALPSGINLQQVDSSAEWNSVENIDGWDLSTRVRSFGWHCVWLSGAFSKVRLGRTSESASSRAVEAVLDRVSKQFNAAEIGLIQVTSYGAFHAARVTVHSWQIQQEATLASPKTWLRENDDTQKIPA